MKILTTLKLPFVWAFSAGILAAIITILMPNYYRSEARLLPVEPRTSGAGISGLASTAAAFGIALPGTDGSDANFVDILNSRWLLEQVATTEFQFSEQSWRFGSKSIKKMNLCTYFKAPNLDRAIMALGTVLHTSRDMRTRVITVAAETKSPELSQQVVQRAVKLLEQFNQQKGRTRGGAKASFAEARLQEAKQELDASEEDFRRFLEGNRGYQTSADPSVRLEGMRLETEYRRRQQLFNVIAMNREQALMEEKNDIPIVNIMDPANLPQEKSRPKRANTVMLVMVFTGVLGWVWQHWTWIKANLRANYEEPKGES